MDKKKKSKKCKHEHPTISDSIALIKFSAHCFKCGKRTSWVNTIKQALKELNK
jgi:hypothetical protein